MTHDPAPVTPYGLLAEFRSPEALVVAAQAAYNAGYRRMEAYSPFPVHGLSEAVGYQGSRLPRVVFLGAVLGGFLGFLLQWYTAVVDYPINIAGRPLNSWPMFIPITFECTVLGGALSAVFGMLWFNGLPMPYHPVFNVASFSQASRDKFFLSIQQTDALFNLTDTRRFLETLGPVEISEVPR
jgi:Protein of unknown function (DUF3341)